MPNFRHIRKSTSEAQKNIKRKPVFFWVFLAIVLLLPVLVALVISSGHSSDSVGREGKGIQGSRFYRYNAHVYVLIPGGGYYILPEADLASFEPLAEGHSYYPLAKDKNAIYCGTDKIEGARVEDLLGVSGGYLRTKNAAFYCGREKLNPAYHWWDDLFGSHDENDPKKVKYYYNEWLVIQGVKPLELKKLIGDYATDSQTVFYKGVPMAQSKPDSASGMVFRQNGREAFDYLKDANAVYFQGQPLENAHPRGFELFEPEADQHQQYYGQDAQTRRYYFRDKIFPKQVDGASTDQLQLLIADRKKSKHELFYNKNGLFYWDYNVSNRTQGKLVRACDNPFAAGPLTVVSPGIFKDAHSTYAIQSRSQRRYRTSGGTTIENSYLVRLKNPATIAWRNYMEGEVVCKAVSG